MAALCRHSILRLWLLSFSTPILSGRRLDVYHTSTHGVALLRIYNARLKFAARGSLKYRMQKIAKNPHLRTIAQLRPAIIGN